MCVIIAMMAVLPIVQAIGTHARGSFEIGSDGNVKKGDLQQDSTMMRTKTRIKNTKQQDAQDIKLMRAKTHIKDIHQQEPRGALMRTKSDVVAEHLDTKQQELRGTLMRTKSDKQPERERERDPQRSVLKRTLSVHTEDEDPTEEAADPKVHDAGADDEGDYPAADEAHANEMQATYGESSGLAAALPLVLMNLSNFSGLLDSKNAPHFDNNTHHFGTGSDDLALLYEKVAGFYHVLHESMDSAADGATYCPFESWTYIPSCVSIAMCLIAKDVPAHAPLELYTIYTEVEARFHSITWDNIEAEFASEGQGDNIQEHEVPAKYRCDSPVGEDESTSAKYFSDDDTALPTSDDGPSLVQADSQALAATLAVSAALGHATLSTHAILDAHKKERIANNGTAHRSHMDATVAALRAAWQGVCESMQCDHTNYVDLFAASHGHTHALIQHGASARHLRAHITKRVKLEIRVQHFLAEHGEAFAAKAYRADDMQASNHQKIDDYLKIGRDAMGRYVLPYIASLDDTMALRLVDSQSMEVYFDDAANSHAEVDEDEADEDQDDGEDDALAYGSTVAKLSTPTASTGLIQRAKGGAKSKNKYASKWGGRRRRRRRRRRFWGAIGKAIKTVGKAIVTVVKAVVSFVADLFKCFGQPKVMTGTGYGKKWPEGDWKGVAVSVSMGVGMGANSFKDMMTGKFAPGFAIGISLVVGVVPQIPEVGGLRVGVGIGGGIACSHNGCSVGIAVGIVTSACWPRTTCLPFGPKMGPLSCFGTGGLAITAICCSFNMFMAPRWHQGTIAPSALKKNKN